ncbi:hypothetical protein [Streptomyces iranensis]|uniref:Lipoprotein n=1 Tax=Streptomyces iranensis TaxID=576784 RepID=A0A060ZSJ5_9ACTN|nr:hypothetical protein [Streptomyces iranensis]MBP2060897.1 hypothetical protein [Streptomyces iranensis]CDR06361.1 predicted protein [Streptomyces iranensis]
MRGKPSPGRRDPLAAASAAFGVAAVLLLAGCGTDDSHPEAASPKPSTTTTSAGTSPPPTSKPPTTPVTPSASPTDHRLPVQVPSDASDQAKEDLLGLRALELQSALRDIDPALGAAEDINKAGEQCYDLRRKAANPDEKAARRFSSAHHKVTVSNGKRINALLREGYCS